MFKIVCIKCIVCECKVTPYKDDFEIVFINEQPNFLHTACIEKFENNKVPKSSTAYKILNSINN